MAADEILRAKQLVSGRRWLAPGPVHTWYQELDELRVRGHEAESAIGALRELSLKHQASALDQESLAAASGVYIESIGRQLEAMRVHLVRATTIAGAHAVIIATTYAKPVCDLMAEHYDQVIYHPEDYDKYLEGFGKCSDALEALYEILVPLFVEAGRSAPTDRSTLADFPEDRVAQVRRAILEHGPNAKYDQLFASSRPIGTQMFNRILRLVRSELAG